MVKQNALPRAFSLGRERNLATVGKSNYKRVCAHGDRDGSSVGLGSVLAIKEAANIVLDSPRAENSIKDGLLELRIWNKQGM